MASKRLDYWNARVIAERVANKAFEHLITPPEQQIKIIAASAYCEALENIGLTQSNLELARKHNLVEAYDQCNVIFGSENDSTMETTLTDGNFITARFTVFDEKHIADAKKIWPEYWVLHEARENLMNTVRNQMAGKSVAAIKKNWPEISGFIDDVLGKETNEMTVPFENLLMRFLPALPAPTTV